jgi:peroxiredoxin
MIKTVMLGILGLMVGMGATARAQETEVGKPAPDFTLTDTAGKTHALSSFKGKFVVLEWTNHDCPFVKKHYDGGNMQGLQKTYTGKDAVWLTIGSSAAGKQGNFTPEKWDALTKEKNAAPTAVLLDADGKVGRLYGAKTTPHMVVIGKDGTLVYMGGIDDKPAFDPATLKDAKNFVSLALDAAMAGKPVETPTAPAYGCSVKY